MNCFSHSNSLDTLAHIIILKWKQTDSNANAFNSQFAKLFNSSLAKFFLLFVLIQFLRYNQFYSKNGMSVSFIFILDSATELSIGIMLSDKAQKPTVI